MTYLTERRTSGRRPLTIVEIDLDTCANTYGVLPCTASRPVGSECYNTFETCQDKPNFVKGVKTLRFCEDIAGLPLSLGAIPSIPVGGVKLDPTIIDPAKTLGVRAKVTIQIKDFPHHDRGIDPYVATRSYEPTTRGTFFGKLIARNPNYEGRPLRVIVGYLDDDGVFQAGDTRLYIIDKINGPGANSSVTLIAKDILKLAEDKRSKTPRANDGKIVAEITDSATTLTLGAGQGAAYVPSILPPTIYPAQGTIRRNVIRIDKELMTFTILGDVMTIVRGQFGTDAKRHSSGASVQQCVHYLDVNAVDIAKDLLVNADYGAGIDPAFIPDLDWKAEADIWLQFNEYTRVLSKPEGINKLLSELCEQSLISMWWNERQQRVELKSMSPPLDVTTIPTLTDDSSILKGTLKTERLTEQRISQIWLYNELEDQADDNKKTESYERVDIRIDLDSEGDNSFGDKREKLLLGTWLTDVSTAVKIDVTTKTINKFRRSPVKAKFSLDAKDSDIWTGSVIFVETDQIQDATGQLSKIIMLVTKAREASHGTTIEYEATTAFDYQVNWARWVPDGIPDHGVASDEEKEIYLFWADELTGFMPNGDDPYVWL